MSELFLDAAGERRRRTIKRMCARDASWLSRLEKLPWRRLSRYAAVSVVASATGQIVLVSLYYFAHWSARPATFASCVAGGIPSYYLNRRWAWGKSGRSHIVRELTPFWILTLGGLALSTWLAGYAGSYAEAHFDTRALQTVVVDASSFVAFGTLWVVKFVAFNRFMFGTSDEVPSPEL